MLTKVLGWKRAKMKLLLWVCASCGWCAKSCFMYNHHGGDPSYMPSYKARHSLGKLYKKKGKMNIDEMEEIKDLAWNKCVLCERCYCPLGIDVPAMIARARSICRSQGVFRVWDENKRKANQG